MMRKALKAGIAALVLCLQAGCGSAPAIRHYAVAAPSAVAGDGIERPLAVVVRELRLPPYLDRPQLVTRDAEQRIRIADGELWAGDLRQNLMQVLADSLGRALGSRQVVAAPHSLALRPDFRVDLEIRRFEQGADGRVVLSARWWLTGRGEGAAVTGHDAEFTAAPVPSRAFEAIVGAMGGLNGDLAQAIAGSIRARQAGGA